MNNDTPRRQSTLRAQRSGGTQDSPKRRGTSPKKSSFKEKFLMQCIVSSIILASALLIRVVNVGFTNRLQGTLKIAISNDANIDNIKGTFDFAKTSLNDAGDSFKTAFGNNSDKTENSLDDEARLENEDVETKNELELSTETSTVPEPIEEKNIENKTKTPDETDSNFRIDEDILDKINSYEDTYNSQKKPLAPN